MQLFEEKEGKVIVATELKLVPEFKKIINGDRDAVKRYSTKVFGYIYFMYDFKSPYMVLPEKERRIKVIEAMQLPEGWKEDLEVADAVRRYKAFQETPSLKMLSSLREGLFASRDAIDVITGGLSEAVQNIRNAGFEPNEEEPGSNSGIDRVMEFIDNLFKIADKLPKMFDALKTLEDKVKTEQSEGSKIRGGGTKGLFED